MSRKQHREKMLRLFLGFVLLMSASLTSIGHVAKAEDRHDAELTISPTPQQLKVTGEGFPLTPVVGLVVGQKTDSDAVREVKHALHAADVRRIVTRKASEGKPETPVTIWIGGPSENPTSMDALQSLGVTGPQDLRKEGYVLASGHGNGHKMIVLAGKDTSGTFYAAQTFEQMILPHPGRDWIPSVEIRDWPQMAIRGTIEGFYGPPWSHQDRMSQIEFYGENKMNTYVYAPKDDPYHRDKWREPYPEKRLNQIRELVAKSRKNHVDFVFGLSPGKSICYSGDEDFQLLMDKMQKMYDIGIRSFAIFLDDISRNLRCGQDKERFGDESSPAAAAQAYLLNRFQDAFIETHEGTARLVTVPTDYAGTSDSDYISLFAELVSPKVIVDWTGPAVVSHEITASQAEKASNIYEHDLLIWDNYPVNDYARNRLFLGPLVNRDSNLTEHGVLGITANPMNEAEASKISLYTVADYMWNSDAYEPMESWKRSLQAFAGDSY
ncbi:MAG TPA: beta-N-acetylglucosaminidase domain-containing protein, partial [Bacillales bacterium]